MKSHHYIISFDPRDGTENGLTVDRAQALGMEFAAAQFPGHQALVCTHQDGHNHSGNIHVHIVINSLRIEAVPMLPYMDRPADTKAGCKHRCTDTAMEYFKSEVMDLCHREQLYQIDLLNGSKNRVTEREYWAKKKGQAAIDRDNDKRLAAGEPLCHTKFETDKEKLRQTIRTALARAGSFDEFSALLLRQGVTVKESRGRYSYLTPDRTKPITARRLGDDFDRAAVLAALEQNAVRATEKPAPVSEHRHTAKEHPQGVYASKQDGIERMVDREVARQKGIGYDRWASVHNLKQMAAAHNFLVENDMLDLAKLDAAIDSSRSEYDSALSAVKACETEINQKKKLRTAVINYVHTKPVIVEYQKLKPKKQPAFRAEHDSDFIIYNATVKQLAELCPGNKLPTYKSLNTEIEALISEKNGLYNDYHAKKAEYEQLITIRDTAEAMRSVSRTQKREKER